jgi:hypothetical protein
MWEEFMVMVVLPSRLADRKLKNLTNPYNSLLVVNKKKPASSNLALIAEKAVNRKKLTAY